MKSALAAAALTVALGSTAGAQSWRTVDVSRQLRDTTGYQVHVEYGAGRLELAPASDPVLFHMRLRYDDDRQRPLHAFDASAHALRLGIEDGAAVKLRAGIRGDSGAEMRLALSRDVPIDLSLDLGAVKARVDVGGLSVRVLQVAANASRTELDFSAPNRVPLRSVDVQAGAAELTMRNLGNANTGLVRVNGDVGRIELDFGGEWRQDIVMESSVSLGSLTVRVPRDVGIRLELSRFLASFDHAGLVKRGGAWFSDNWESAPYRLRIRTHAAFGGITIDRSSSGGAPLSSGDGTQHDR